jgi:hypothetical protein
VRASFLCIDAIDSTLRHVCGLDAEHYLPDEVSTALETPCHRYWLEQMKANIQNSVPLHPETYADAVVILQACAASRAARPLLPHSTALASALGYKIWQSMHLQGLAATQDLPVDQCAHFMYKKPGRLDYSNIPSWRRQPSTWVTEPPRSRYWGCSCLQTSSTVSYRQNFARTS